MVVVQVYHSVTRNSILLVTKFLGIKVMYISVLLRLILVFVTQVLGSSQHTIRTYLV